MIRPGLTAKLATYVAMIYVATGFGVFLSVADNNMRKAGTLPVPPTIAAIGFLGSIIAFVLFKDFMNRRPSVKFSTLMKSNVAIIFPFGLLAFISLLLALHPTSYWGDDRKWIYLQSYDFCIFLTAMLLPAVEFIRKRFQFFVIVGLLTMLGSIWYEVQNPGVFSSVPNRASGFPGNSNWGALVTVMICSMALSYRDGPARLLDMIVLAITGLGLYFTLSRSGTMNFVMLLMFYGAVAVFTGRDRVRTALTIFGALGALIAFFLIVIPLAAKNSELMGDGAKSQNRLLAFATGEVADDGSAADRMEAARETLDKIEASPIIGHGTGFNRKMRQTPHNLYLKLWVDAGIFGLVTWISLLISGFWLFTSRKYRPGQGLVLVTFIGGFFSHNILEQRTFLFLFGMAGSMSLFEAAGRVRTATSLRTAMVSPMAPRNRVLEGLSTAQ